MKQLGYAADESLYRFGFWTARIKGTLVTDSRAKTMTALAFRGILLSLSFFSGLTFAQQQGPSQLNISGGLFNPNGTPVTNSSVNFRLEVWDKNATCMLYSEDHNAQNLSTTKGGFSLEIGKGTAASNKIDVGNPTILSAKVFENVGAVAPFVGCAAGVTLASGDVRLIRVKYDLGSGMVAMTPDVPIGSSAYAMVAETLQGKRPTDFVQVRDDATYDLNQANVESIFSAANFAKLTAILSGDASNQKLTNVVDPTAASDAATKGYTDSNVGGKIVDFTGIGPAVGDGKTIIWDQAQNKWVTGVPAAIDASKLPLAGGTMTGAIAMGAQDITNIGHMTMAAQRTLNLGTYTDPQEVTLVAGLTAADKGKVWFNTTSNTFKVWDGTAAINSAAPSGAAGGDLTGTYPNPTIDALAVDAGKIAASAVTTAKFNAANAVAGGRLMVVDSIDTSRVEYKSCNLNEVLRWEATGWTCVTAAVAIGTTGVTAATYGTATQVAQVQVDAQGRVTSAANVAITFPVVSVAGKTGAVTLNTGDLTNAGTAATKDFGAAAGNLVELDGAGKIPVGLMPTAMGDIQDVIAGSGLTGGGSSGSVTLNVDTGITTGKIVQMAASDKLPAVDGSNLTNVNSTKLQTRDVAATVPAADQVLTWNNGTSAWEPRALPAGNIGDVTAVVASTGLTGGGITGDTTLAVDVGVTTGKIVQMAASDKLPAVDGSNLTQINAIKLQTRDVAATAPTANQVLRWNNGTSVWEPAAETDAFTGTVTSVVSGSGLLGGNITGTGTLSVDVGVTDGKIVQVGVSDRLPAIDGRNLTFINAVQLQTRDVAASAPAADNVLTWNNGTSVWEPRALPAGNIGDMTAVVASTGLTGGGVTGDATLAVDVGVTTGKIVQMAASDKLPAVDGSNLTQINAVKLQTRDVSATAPTANQILKWNNGTSVWEPAADTDTTTTILASTGLTGGTITTNGTIAVDVGVTTGKIIQVAASDRLPVIDGRNLTFINAVQLQARDVSATAPTADQVLTWNNGTSVWEARALPAGNIGDITSVVNGTGLTGGGASGDVTLNIDVGVTTGKIIQVAASDKLPVIDGSNLTQINAIKLQTRDVAATAPTANQVLRWNNGTSVWEPAAETDAFVGTVTSVVSGSGLTGGNITTTGTLAVDVGVTTGKIVQMAASDKLPAVDGSNLTQINAVKLQTRDVSATAPTANQILKWNNGTSIWEPAADTDTTTTILASTGLTGGTITTSGTIAVDVGVTTGKIIQVAVSNKLPVIDGSNLTNVNAVQLQARDVSATAPTADQVLTWNNGTSVWEARALPAGNVGDITSVVNGTGLTGGGASGDVTLNIDVGVTAGKIVQMAASDKLPAVDGSNLTQINAIKLQTRDVSATAPTANQVLRWNNGTSAWEPAAETDAFVGTVTSVVSGSGLTGGNITTTGTLAVDVGVTTGKIVQMAASDKLPAVDGSNLTQINAVKLQTRDVSATAPTANQILKWNNGTSIWEPAADTDTTTTILASTGLTGGTITTNGTIAVDVGVTTGKIIQVAASDKLPVIDGSNLTNVNAVQLQARDVSATAPTADQVLTWNNGTSVWEARALPAGNTGDITSVVNGTGLTGGGASGDVTLNIDVGVTAGKIVQMAASDKLPAVDGSNLTQINAIKLQTRDVAATAPTANQVLRWNNGTSVWEPAAETDAFTGTVTSVVSGTGLTGGNITATGTLAVDVGTVTGKIVQMAASDKLPAVDGSNLTNINASGVTAGAGTVGAPSITFSGDLDTGFYNASSNNTISMAAGAANIFNFSSAGMVSPTVGGGIVTTGAGTTGAPTFTFGGDTDTGIWRAGTNDIGFSANSQFVFRVTDTDVTSYRPITSSVASTYALAVGPNGNTNPSLRVDTNTASAATGLQITSAAAGAGIAITTLSSGANESVSLSAKGTGSIALNSSVGIGTTTPTVGTRLDITGTGAAASSIIIPRDTVANRPTAGVNGMIRYASDTNKFEAYQNGSWVDMIGGGVATLVTASAGTTGAPSISFSGDLDTGLYSNGANTLGVTTGAATIFNFSSAGLVSPTTGGAAITSGNGTVGAPTLTFAGDTDTGWWRPAADTMAASTAGAERIRINSSGSIGIGTTNPAQVLDVIGSAKATTFLGGTGTNLLPSLSFAGDPNTGFYSGGADLITITTNGTARVDIDATGFQSRTTGSFWLQDIAGTAATPSYTFTGDNNTGMYRPAADNLSFVTASADRLRIDSSGNVGIGTTNPTYKLDVSDSSGPLRSITTATTGQPAAFVALNSASDLLELKYTEAAISNIPVDAWQFRVGNTARPIIFSMFDTTPVMTLGTTGNVGIGTASPTAKLEVDGAIVSQEHVVASGGTADFSNGNSIVLQSVGGSTITVSNMVAGGVYNVVVEDTTSRTYTISGCGTIYWSPANGATTNRSVYTIYRRGASTCFITWTTGFN